MALRLCGCFNRGCRVQQWAGPCLLQDRPAVLSCRAPGRRSLFWHCEPRHSPQIQALDSQPAVTGVLDLPQWKSCIVKRLNLDIAIEEAIEGARKKLGGDSEPDVALVFISTAFGQPFEDLVAKLRKQLPTLKYIFGTTGFGIVGDTDSGPEEVEHQHSLSLTLARLPNVEILLKHVTINDLPDGDSSPSSWHQLLEGQDLMAEDQAKSTTFVLLADPTFSKLEDLMRGLDYAYPEAVKVGGLSSGGMMSNLRAMFCWSHQDPPPQKGDEYGMYRTGACLLMMRGDVLVDLLVAQGCRPLSSNTYTISKLTPNTHLVVEVTDTRGNALSPVYALQADLQQVVKSQAQLNQILPNLVVGLAPSSLISGDVPQDFAIRTINVDKAGFLMVGDNVRVGQQFQFMVRDREGAVTDLSQQVTAYKRRELQASLEGRALPPAFGLMLFICNGRGSSLYGEPSYDSRTMSNYVPVPCCGFMCNGEIATVGGETKLHGYTLAAAVLRAGARGPPVGANEGTGEISSGGVGERGLGEGPS